MPDSPKPDKNESRLDKILKQFDYTVERWTPVHEQIDADVKCLSLEGPWPENEIKARQAPGNERPCLHEDIISQFNNQVINQLEMNPMGIDVQPEGDGADEHTAEEVEDRIRQIEYEQNAQQAYLIAGKCAVESSIGFWTIETDWMGPQTWDRRFCINPKQDNKTILVDPDCKKPDWSDMKYAFDLYRLTHDEFKEKYPRAQIHDFEGYLGKQRYSKWIDAKTVQLAAYWYIENEKKTLLLLDDGTPEGWTIFEDELPDILKRRGNVVRLEASGYEFLDLQKGHEYPILKESKRQVPKVKKCLTNGVEILEETEWEDEEIPIMVVNGRVRFEHGERVIESQTRKARVGQLLYDLCISAIQQETAQVAKITWLGYEGQFDTATDWTKIHREPSATAEAKATTDEVGSEKPLPLPQQVDREPKIGALLELKNSILLSIQNVLGQASTERKDRASKSGKALEQLNEDMNVATSHYHGSLRMAQVRQYRILNRMLAKVENTPREVGLRSARGDYRTQKIEQNHYQQLGRHQVVIGSAKYYQSLQEERSDFAESLLSNVKDETIMLAILPDIIRMKGLEWDDLANMVEAMQPPQMQAARANKTKEMSPAMLQAIQAQAQQTVQAAQLQMQELAKERDQLLFEKKAEILKLQMQKQIHDDDNKVKLEAAAIAASTKERMDSLDAQVGSIAHMVEVLTTAAKLAHEAQQNSLDRQHEHELVEKQAAITQQQQENQPESVNA